MRPLRKHLANRLTRIANRIYPWHMRFDGTQPLDLIIF